MRTNYISATLAHRAIVLQSPKPATRRGGLATRSPRSNEATAATAGATSITASALAVRKEMLRAESWETAVWVVLGVCALAALVLSVCMGR